MRWNGGRNLASSWHDIVCKKCKATYEIKSKRDNQAIEDCFKFNRIPGGSFSTFHEYKAFGRSRFLLLVSRKPDVDLSGLFFYPVTVALIEDALPALKDKSFHNW